ncbi:glycosyltransferase family 9 protein [Candidatus Woesearchaeota archaeon]|nr:glycosyltransferase family 9 protein [Candidatus Woesearchaeota archaeon]
MKILIIKLGAIGDVLRTTAILQGLKEKYRNCYISWATKKESFGILKNNKFIDRIFLIGNGAKNELKEKECDLVISLDDNYEACEFASGVNPKKLVGAYLKDNKRAYTKDSALWFDMGLISRFGKKKADILKAKNKKTYQEIMYKMLGLKYKKQEPILNLTKKELDFGREFAQKNKIGKKDLVIGINTGAGGRWHDKKLSIEKAAELVDELNKIKNARLLLFGGPEEKERNGRIKKLIKTKIIDAGCSNSLMEFASLVNLCNILVTSDSLAMHIGVALKKKVVAFFCPTSPYEIELYNRGIKIVPRKGCVCCYKEKCDITPEYDVDEIVRGVKKLI